MVDVKNLRGGLMMLDCKIYSLGLVHKAAREHTTLMSTDMGDSIPNLACRTESIIRTYFF